MIIEPFARRFGVLKNNNNHIQYVLDIGAYRGDFTQTVKYIWPSAIVRQIEADERQLPWLQDNAIIALLGDIENPAVDFYTLSDDKITTGSSIYKELTPHYTSSSTVVIQKSMTTLDILDAKHNFFGNWKDYGLVKIDTQGSELIILAGAKTFLATKQPKYILLECSVQQYNKGAPSFGVIIETLTGLGYGMKDIFDLSYDGNHALLQTDILFERL
jgi:FkbM family methyltransferase